MSDLTVAPGTLLAEKYRVLRVLGEGGMGVVVEAMQLGLERRVAIKFLHADSRQDALVTLLRFEREARAVARLRGEHVVQVYDVGKLDGGEPFIAMELLEGQDLLHRLASDGRLPVAEAVGYVLQACEAMAEAHVAGIVHRDLKPANLFVARRPDGRPLLKVLDFGISKITAGEEDLGLTSTRGAIGSPLYMSPEQLGTPKNVDHRTDVWSLGAVLFELLTGTSPFHAGSLARVQVDILTAPAPELTTLLPDAPPGLAAVVRRCLAKRPDDRFQTMATLAVALEPFAPKSALSSVGAAVRILRGSALDPGDLPQTSSALLSSPVVIGEPSFRFSESPSAPRPSAIATVSDPGTAQRAGASVGAAATKISVAPSENADLKPTVARGHESTLAASSWMNDSERSAGVRRGRVVVAVVLLAAGAVGVLAIWRLRHGVRAEPAASTAGAEPSAAAPAEIAARREPVVVVAPAPSVPSAAVVPQRRSAPARERPSDHDDSTESLQLDRR